RQHVRGAEPLVRRAAVRLRRGEPRGDGALAIVVALEGDAARGALRRGTALADGGERRLDVVVDRGDVRREAQRRGQLSLERYGIGDVGEGLDALLPGGERELTIVGI